VRALLPDRGRALAVVAAHALALENLRPADRAPLAGLSRSLAQLHSDQRLMRKTVRFEIRPSMAPTGHRNRQYRFLMKSVAASSTASPIHIDVVPKETEHPERLDVPVDRHVARRDEIARTPASRPYLIQRRGARAAPAPRRASFAGTVRSMSCVSARTRTRARNRTAPRARSRRH